MEGDVIEFGMMAEADAALAAMVETFLDTGPYHSNLWTGGTYSVYRDGLGHHSDCDSSEEADAICALLNYRYHKEQRNGDISRGSRWTPRNG